MFNLKSYLPPLAAALLISTVFIHGLVSSANEPTNLHSQDHQDLTDAEIIISTGPKEAGSSTLVTKSKSQLFCNSANLAIEIDSRLDDYNDETFKSFDMSAAYNGKRIDLTSGKGLPNLDDFYHIVPDMICRKNQIFMFLIGYNDSSAETGATLMEVKIDTISGNIK